MALAATQAKLPSLWHRISTLQVVKHLKMDVNSAQPVTQGQPKSLLATVTTVLSAISVARSVLPVEWLIRRCNKFGRIRRITQPDCVYNFSAYNNSSSPDGNFEKIKVYLSKHSNFDAQRSVMFQEHACSGFYVNALLVETVNVHMQIDSDSAEEIS